MLVCQTLALMGFSAYASCLMSIQAEWQLTNFESGFLASCFFIGYIFVVPIATSLTDRIDTRQVYLAGGSLACFGLMGMSYSSGFLSACLFLTLHGAGLSATYMPGLKILTDRLRVVHITRHISFYTAFFGIGSALSYFFSGVLIQSHGWRAAFVMTALGPFLAGVLAWFGTKRLAHEKSFNEITFKLQDALPFGQWKKVLQIQETVGYMLGYAAHSIELFASRSWLVAFFTFCITTNSNDATFPFTATVIATLINLIGVPASILGNELAVRVGRHRLIYWVMIGSAVFGILLGNSVHWHWTLILSLAFIHSIFIMADSATLTAGLVISAPKEIKGAAMGLHSLFGFGGGLLGPALFGMVLDISRYYGRDGWGASYTSIVIWGVIFAVGMQFFTWRRTRKSYS